MNKIPVVVFYAPTASGKTALALDLFGSGSLSFFKGHGELISADSIQIYKGLDIGTAKPSKAEQEVLVHHLIDLYNPNEQYSCADFVQKADFLCKNIFERGKIPIIAGGSGFYIRNFIFGLPKTPETDLNIRYELNMKLEKYGSLDLHKELEKVDFESACKINKNDGFRIVRALEIFYSSGKPRSFYLTQNSVRSAYDFKVVILNPVREVLYDRIDERVEQMFRQNLTEEVINLMKNGCTKDMPGMQGIGYREFFLYYDGTSQSLENVKYNIKRNSRKYAKKQYTFMKEIPNAFIVENYSDASLYKTVEQYLLKEFSVG